MSFIKRVLGSRKEVIKDFARQMHLSGSSSSEIAAAIRGNRSFWGKTSRTVKNPDATSERFGLVQVSFTGIEELDKKIRELNVSLQKKALRKATRRVAKFTLQLMKKEIPHNSGFLESQLVVRAKKRSRKYPQTVGVTVGFPDDLFKGDTFYAGFLEFGTEQRTTKAKANRGRIEQGRWDFMRVSLWSFIEQKQQMFREEILKWLRDQQAKGTVT